MIKKLIKLSKFVSKFTVGAEGNISCKTSNGFIIKSSGKSLRSLTNNDFVICDSNGNKIDKSDNKPSIETSVHCWIYNNFDVNYISHTHPINTLKILCSTESDNFANYRLFPDQVVFNGKKSCIVDYKQPGIDLCLSIENSVNIFKNINGESPKILLLKNHGIITFGKNIQECVIASEICEKSAEIFLGSLFSPKYLSYDEIERISLDTNEKYRYKINEK